ncbi:DUF1501 domain-containing protein [Membranihabitans marinus]|uniref:DUF1501 domain-containing protein n=1 Tax=Membranihabitans marinus TaxID=1227546 RepID=UPI001F2D4E75|nr:DUF1501 domain-containing protein [Membranihabitans marinus]
MKKYISQTSRRKFLSQMGCAALGYSTFYSSIINLKALNAAAIDNSDVEAAGDYKAMVCILLSGGNDSFNMLIPHEQSAYQNYATTRSNLSIPHSDLLALRNQGSGLTTHAVHPGMTEVQTMYNNGELAFVSNVGTLIEPTTKEQFHNNSHRLPLGLLSHADQIQQWQTGLPHERSATGWGARVTEMIQSMNTNQNISMNISLSGNNVFQQGNGIFEFSIGSDGATGIYGFDNDWNIEQVRTDAIKNFMDHQYEDIFKQTYVNTIKNAHNATLEFQEGMEHAQDFGNLFSSHYLSQNLEMIAKVISVQAELGFNRQIFFVNFGGWDHHDDVIEEQNEMLPVLSKALYEFQQALKIINKQDEVTSFTISDFARTLTSNGNGTDHAWGGNTIVAGGAVNGGKIYGQYPNLALKTNLDLGNGVLIPTTSADEYFAELALWYGVSSSEVHSIFPNLKNFYAQQSTSSPIGFLNQ